MITNLLEDFIFFNFEMLRRSFTALSCVEIPINRNCHYASYHQKPEEQSCIPSKCAGLSNQYIKYKWPKCRNRRGKTNNTCRFLGDSEKMVGYCLKVAALPIPVKKKIIKTIIKNP